MKDIYALLVQTLDYILNVSFTIRYSLRVCAVNATGTRQNTH